MPARRSAFIAVCALLGTLPGSSVLAQTVARGVAAVPIAPYAAPLVPRQSFLQGLALSASLFAGGLPSQAALPSLAEVTPPIAAPTADLRADRPIAVVAIPVDPVSVRQALPDGQGRAPVNGPASRPSLLRGPADSFLRGLADRQAEATPAMGSRTEADAVSQGASLFDGAQRQKPVELAPVRSAPPSRAGPDYLRQTEGLTAEKLLVALHWLAARGHTVQSYDDARRFMYATADHVEKDGRTGILDAYSGLFLPGTGGNGDRYTEIGDENGDGYSQRDSVNAEHVWPQSFFNRSLPMRSDLHHLMATLAHPNSIRSNLPFGEVPDDRPEYSNNGGARMGHGMFEPPDISKGRVARAAFYFFTRYYDANIYQGAGRHFWTPRVIQTLLDWNRRFPPTEWEQRRNDLVEGFQGNRNPFVDDPGLADRIGLDGFASGTTSHFNSVLSSASQARERSEPSIGGERRREGVHHGRRWGKRHGKKERRSWDR